MSNSYLYNYFVAHIINYLPPSSVFTSSPSIRSSPSHFPHHISCIMLSPYCLPSFFYIYLHPFPKELPLPQFPSLSTSILPFFFGLLPTSVLTSSSLRNHPFPPFPYQTTWTILFPYPLLKIPHIMAMVLLFIYFPFLVSVATTDIEFTSDDFKIGCSTLRNFPVPSCCEWSSNECD